ncbi:hypothetical protein HDU98_005051 [Podochytrium sp. JEL0797]|nr:hypothetical protein HDU98_005051 [Podochytrium sp. JEL0797]
MTLRSLERTSDTTNTLLFTNLHHSVFESSGSELRSLVERNGGRGHIVRFIPITSFFRFLVVFDSPETAAIVKQELHGTDFLGQKTVRVYFGDNTDSNHLMNPNAGNTMNLLQVPPLEKNFLLSPPGSPPVGWVQPSEAQPSRGGHHQAMIDALVKLADEDDFALDGDGSGSESGSMDRDSDRRMRDSDSSIGSSENTSPSESSRDSYTMEGTYKNQKEIEERLGYRPDRKTKHVLTFGPHSSREKPVEEGGMDWEMDLPMVVVVDHDHDSDSDVGTGSGVSLNKGFSMILNDDEEEGDSDSMDSRASGRSGARTPMPHTSMPPRTAMPPMNFQH